MKAAFVTVSIIAVVFGLSFFVLPVKYLMISVVGLTAGVITSLVLGFIGKVRGEL